MMSEIVAHVPIVEAEEVCHYPSSLAEFPNSPSLASSPLSPSLAEGVGGGSLRAPSVPLDSRAANRACAKNALAHIVAHALHRDDVALENTA